jgi:hypothetical protein
MYKYYIVLCPVLVMSGLFSYLRKPGWLRLFLVGLTVVLAGLYRQDYGAYAFLICTLFLGIRPMDGCSRLASIVRFWCAVLLFALPWLIFLVLHGGLTDYLLISIFQAPRAIMSIALSSPPGGEGL